MEILPNYIGLLAIIFNLAGFCLLWLMPPKISNKQINTLIPRVLLIGFVLPIILIGVACKVSLLN